MQPRIMAAVAAVSLFGLMAAYVPASAQGTGTQTPGQSNQSGTTSGPAAGSPATMGTTGTAPGSPHQMQDVRNPGEAVTRQTEQGGAAQGTGSVGTGQPAKPGVEGGPAPK